MSLMDDIRAKQLAARTAKSEFASLYTTLLGEASAIGEWEG